LFILRGWWVISQSCLVLVSCILLLKLSLNCCSELDEMVLVCCKMVTHWSGLEMWQYVLIIILLI
jgi:hypothetical protein